METPSTDTVARTLLNRHGADEALEVCARRLQAYGHMMPLRPGDNRQACKRWRSIRRTILELRAQQ